MLAFLCKLTV